MPSRREPMRRGGPIVRKQGLTPGTSLPPGGALSRRAPMRSTTTGAGGKPRATATVSSRGPVPMPGWLAEYVLVRAGWRCDRCGRPVGEIGYSRQHRRARGMGGRADGSIHTPGNVVVLCGSATTGCHGFVEFGERAQGEREGWVIKGEVIDPAVHPALRHGRRLEIPTGEGWIPAEDWVLPCG